MDHVANERLYGKPVEPGEILDGKLPPPNSFKQLIDTLNAVEDGKFERHASDADSDISSQGVHLGLDRALVSIWEGKTIHSLYIFLMRAATHGDYILFSFWQHPRELHDIMQA